MGGHVDLPSAADQSNGFTAEEFELAQETEDLDRQKLGAIGGRVGIGADLEVVRHLRLGMSWAIDVQQSLRAENDPASANTWVSAEGALLLEIHWPPRGDEPDQAPISSDRSDASIPQAE
jgi:hypothetical protein